MIDLAVYAPLALSVLSNLLAGGAWLYGWQSRKHSAHASDLRELELRIQQLDLEHSIQRERLQHIPTTGQFHDLHAGLAELRGDIKALTATITPLEKTVGLIDVHLRSLGKPTAA